jgi:hypothetical protein
VGRTALSELQSVHEELWKAEIDPANFRRSLTTPSPTAAPDSYVEPTGQRAKASHRCGARGGPRSTRWGLTGQWQRLPGS